MKKASKSDLSTILGIGERRIEQLIAEGAIPEPERGLFDLPRAVRGYVHFVRTKAEAPTLLEARRRKLEADAQMRELDLDERKRALIPMADVIEFFNGIWIPVRGDLTHVGQKVAQDVAKAAPDLRKIDTIIDDEIRRVLEALSQCTMEEFLRRVEGGVDIASGEDFNAREPGAQDEPKKA